MKATIKDVAMEAGVSIATVSRAINNNYPVNDKTREKIDKAIKKLNYIPNEVARNLVLKTTFNIAIVIPSTTNLFFSIIVEEINKVLVEKGYIITLYITSLDSAKEKEVVENIISRNIDGMIAIDPSRENLENGFFNEVFELIPSIIINGNIDSNKYNFITYDDVSGAKDAFEYLKTLNHEAITFIRGDNSLSYDIKETIYSEFISKNNYSYKQVVSVGMGNSSDVISRTEEVFGEILDSDLAGTAVFCCNDLMAVGVINACNKRGIKVPKDLSIIGYDNTIISTVTNPTITTVDLKMKIIAETAGKKIIHMITNNCNRFNKIIFDTELIINKSCYKRIGS